MTAEEKELFNKLTQKRRKTADALNDPSVGGIRKMVVEKYSDQAHFVYELLQNADDVGATKVSFELEDDRLIFRHNGKKHFTITDVTDESDQTKLGDLNAITSIGNSSKPGSVNTEQKIGKFGVGFKAVFQYTNSPIIYDPTFKFKIEELIVPIEIENDFPNRNADETIFEFPFNLKEKSQKDCFDEISYKLRNLNYPVLFLKNLESINFKDKNGIGYYSKNIESERTFDNTTAQLIQFINYDNGKENKERLWLFTRYNEQNLNYCVGFFVGLNEIKKKNKKNSEESTLTEEILIKKTVPAFCYFPTQVNTKLNFIIHAPFLLTDSREGIKAGENHNHEQIKMLGKLSADCLLYLKEINPKFINERIFDLIPYDATILQGDNKNRLSFLPFYKEIFDAFCNEELLPASDGSFIKSENAFMAYNKNLTRIFSNDKLNELFDLENIKWCFPSINVENLEEDNEDLFEYLNNFTRKSYLYENDYEQYLDEFDSDNEDNYTHYYEIFRKITPKFIENQSIEWLAKFYGHIADNKTYSDLLKDEPIFLDTNGKAVAAYDKNKYQNLFLPSKNVSGYTTINSELLSKEQTKKLIKVYELREPSLKDEILKVIIPTFNDTDNIDNYEENFRKIFSYYLEANREEREELLNILINKWWVRNISFVGDYYLPTSLYFKTDTIACLFDGVSDINFIDINYYRKLINPNDENELETFFAKLKVKTSLQYIESQLESNAVRWGTKYLEYKDYKWPSSTNGYRFIEKSIPNLYEILEKINSEKNFNKSIVLWAELLRLEKASNNYDFFDNYLSLKCYYKYYSNYYRIFSGRGEIWLKNKPWLFDKSGNVKAASEIYISELSTEYDVSSSIGKAFVKFLGIKDNPKIAMLNSLSEEEREEYLEFQKIKALGLTYAEMKEYAERKNSVINYDASNYSKERNNNNSNSQSSLNYASETNNIDTIDFSKQNTNHSFEEQSIEKSDEKTPVFNEIKKAIRQRHSQKVENALSTTEYNEIDSTFESAFDDSDDYSPKIVDFQNKIERAKNKTINEIMQYERAQKLQDIAKSAVKYSYAWFKALLELEIINSNDNNLNSREISICFYKVELEEGTTHTLILKHPNRAIPQFMEELTDISLKIVEDGNSKNLTIEAINVHSYNLRVKLKANTDLSKIHLDKITEAHIEAMSPVFLLDELKKSFEQLGFDNNKNLQADLCKNIEFVFGPPGTGKTTHLAKDVLIPLIKKGTKKILVLTPTNKAADVLVNKILEFENNPDWLIRFGVTCDEKIESSRIFKDRDFDIKSKAKAVVVTTIARFPYDYFMTDSVRYEIKELKWDYIIVDEASMIPLINIIYPLYKKYPEKFIIAGDPFQIEPITAVDLWKDENIYTLVNLNSFTNPKTIPHDYPVKLLSTQYRSIPVIGQIYGHICYGNVLKHYRTKNSAKSLNLNTGLNFNKVNLIYFPVSDFESIYKAKRLNHKSPYQIYLAIFIYEFVNYISNHIASDNKKTIGIIAPYKAQADLIQKLCERQTFNKNLEIQVSTIHGFQGDECDIIIDVFNTPESISNSGNVFLNKKNIINVAVSRARDYLFIVMPDKQTKNRNNLKLLNNVENLCLGCGAATFTTKQLEKIIFDNEDYIEENTFSTSHQNVNVYGTPEKKYEVRTEESAVDIQIHKKIAVIKVGKK